MRWRAFGPSFQGQCPILCCRKVESFHFRDKIINYIEQEIQRGSTYIKLRSSFLSVRANSTVEGGQSRNKPLAQRIMILLAYLLIRTDIYRVHHMLTPSHVSSALIPSPKITNTAHLNQRPEQCLRSWWSHSWEHSIIQNRPILFRIMNQVNPTDNLKPSLLTSVCSTQCWTDLILSN